MATKSLRIASPLLLIAVLGNQPVAIPDSLNFGISTQREGAPIADSNYESRVGWTIAPCLISGCSVFIGTIQETIGVNSQAETEETTGLVPPEVTIRIDEWVHGEPPRWKHKIQLRQLPMEFGMGLPTLHHVEWRGVKLVKGGKLLVAFYPPPSVSKENPEILSKIDRYGLVVSNEDLFPVIRLIAATHSRIVRTPEQMLDVPALFDPRNGAALGGYLVGYIWRTGGDQNPEVEASMISQLIGSPHIPEAYWRLLERPLINAMTADDAPVSEATRNQVAGRLVDSASGTNLILARTSLRVLAFLCDSDRISIVSFLTEDRRRALIRNYRTLITPELVENRQAALEAQLGLKLR
jgi:hypothetical protein